MSKGMYENSIYVKLCRKRTYITAPIASWLGAGSVWGSQLELDLQVATSPRLLLETEPIGHTNFLMHNIQKQSAYGGSSRLVETRGGAEAKCSTVRRYDRLYVQYLGR